MKHLSIIAIIILATITNSFAQEKEESSKWEIYGGYSTIKPKIDGQSLGENTERRGFEVSVTRNLNRYLGLKFDYSRNSISERVPFSIGGTPTDLDIKGTSHLYTGGIQIKDNSAKSIIKPFAHALFGAATGKGKSNFVNCPANQTNCSITNSETNFAMIFGGGVDVKVNKRFSVRPIQIDFIKVRNGLNGIIGENNVRLGAGVVFHVDQTEIQTNSKPKSYPQYEIHVGYSYNKRKYETVQTIGNVYSKGLQGYNASVKWNFQRFLGAEFEQSSGWAGTESASVPGTTFTAKRILNTFAGGIQVKDNAAKTRFKPFGHALFGTTLESVKVVMTASNISLKNTVNQSDFLMIFGGGLDVKLNDKFSLRPFQFDFLRSRNTAQGNVTYTDYYRFGAGIVFH